MRALQIEDTWGIDHLTFGERALPEPEAGQVRVRMEAASLNYRDYLTVLGHAGDWPRPFVPFSDGAGVVDAVGADVRRVQVGQRVCPLFYQRWLAGPPSDSYRPWVLGGTQEGVLQEYVVLDADGVTPAPQGWTSEEAATLPCAALTAWRAVVEEGNVQPGQTVLLQGTGGVSIFALQFAHALGARTVITSSSDQKLERARGLGADITVNYRTSEDWAADVLAAAGNEGVDLVVEVGGANTFNPSIRCARTGGRIALIGVLSGFRQEIMVPAIFGKQLAILGISVGNREHFEAMTAAIERHDLRPVIDHVYPWSETATALREMERGGHFGKLVVDIA